MNRGPGPMQNTQQGGAAGALAAYADEGDDPWGVPPESASAPDPVEEEQRQHHEKIHLPEAFAKLGLEPAICDALADIH